MIDRNPKPGETWRARSGAIFPLLARFNPNDGYTLRQDVSGLTATGTTALCWTASGRFLTSEEHPLDLIERVKVVPDPHPEPRVWWVNLYEDENSVFFGPLFATRARADNAKHDGIHRIACVRVTEGQFDD